MQCDFEVFFCFSLIKILILICKVYGEETSQCNAISITEAKTFFCDKINAKRSTELKTIVRQRQKKEEEENVN